jgi:replication factor C subunit 1
MNNTPTLQWVDKYRPTTTSDILGNTDNVIKIKQWLNNFKNKKIADQKTFKNAILISGPPGIGKTSAAHILMKEAGFDTIEFNASELRTSRELSDKLHSILNAKSIKMMFNKSLVTGIIMDEIDGIENKKECTSSDLIDFFNFETNKFYARKANKKILKKHRHTHINKNPIICICNSVDKNLSSVKKK